METLFLILAAILYPLTVYAGWKICKWKNRWTAVVATVCIPFAGLLIALFLDAKCRHCQEYMSMAASVCPHCGRNTRDGKVTVRR